MNLFESAEYAETLSTCLKRKVGASLMVRGEVVAIGFNHADENCTCDLDKENPNVKHAEVSCLEHYELLSSDNAEMAVTYMCCIDCAKFIVKKHVKRVFIRDWRDDKMQGVDFLKLNNVEVLKWNN